MATISSPGIGSSLDVNSIITQLMATEQQPLTDLQTKATAITTKISAFGQIKSQMASLDDAVTKLSSADLWSGKTASSSLPANVTVTATGSAAATSFSLNVQQLATAQSAASAQAATGATFSGGTLTLQIGKWTIDPANPTGPRIFDSANASKTLSLTVAAGASMADIAQQINGSNAGVSATLVSDGSGNQQLLMRSNATGEINGFQLQAADDPANPPTAGQTALSGLLPSGGLAPIFGKDALATLNGIAVRSPTNTLADTVPGLSLNLLKVTDAGAPAEISVGSDTGSIQQALTAFVTAYNATNTMLAQATKYDPSTKTAALLQGDVTTTGLERSLRSVVGAIGTGNASSGINSLSDIGISFSASADGSIALDTAKLSKALAANPDAVRGLFIAATASSGRSTGSSSTPLPVGAQLKVFLDGASGATGVLASKATSLQSQQTDNSNQQIAMQNRLDGIKTRLQKQYSALDVIIASSTALDTYVQQQIAQWNRPGG
jgi:flagellar hook-associated protein 2